jgi:HprK-related kinase A
MKLSELGEREWVRRLERGDLLIEAGPFKYRLHSNLERVAEGLADLYPDYPVADPDDFAGISLRLEPGVGIHRWWRRQVRVSSDGIYPFQPLPLSHAFAQMEWALNWCVSTRAHQYLMLHAAVIERGGHAVIMAAPPGSGKSTLCAGLVHRGWRLLTDEIALIAPDTAQVHPAVRPIGLKNQSMAVIGDFAPGATFGRVTPDTSKGAVTHMKVPDAHLLRMHETATPRWIVFPKYVAGAAAQLVPHSRGQSMLELGANSFNYMLLGRVGFETLARVVSMSDCHRFSYGDLDEAVAVFDALAAQPAAGL